jgi:hypothetical protein
MAKANVSFSAVLMEACPVLCLHRGPASVERNERRALRHNWATVTKQNNKLRGLSPRAKYTDRATDACRRS